MRNDKGQLDTVLAKGTPISSEHSFWFESVHSDAYFDVFENNVQIGHFVVAPTTPGQYYECFVRFDQNRTLVLQANVGERKVNGVNVQRQATRPQNDDGKEDKEYIKSFFN